MSFEGLVEAYKLLKANEDAGDAVETLIKNVEDYPYYKSVGFGGLPNRDCMMQMDGAYMDGDTLKIGAVSGASEIKNVISVARDLSKLDVNNFLVGVDADIYARQNNFATQNMLTDRAKKM